MRPVSEAIRSVGGIISYPAGVWSKGRSCAWVSSCKQGAPQVDGKNTWTLFTEWVKELKSPQLWFSLDLCFLFLFPFFCFPYTGNQDSALTNEGSWSWKVVIGEGGQRRARIQLASRSLWHSYATGQEVTREATGTLMPAPPSSGVTTLSFSSCLEFTALCRTSSGKSIHRFLDLLPLGSNSNISVITQTRRPLTSWLLSIITAICNASFQLDIWWWWWWWWNVNLYSAST